MEWYLDPADVVAASQLSGEIRSHLQRHAATPAAVPDAGGQMEAEYRSASRILGRLDVERVRWDRRPERRQRRR